MLQKGYLYLTKTYLKYRTWYSEGIAEVWR
jgi:hypothetical protein